MARSALAIQPHLAAGLQPVYTAANVDGHSVVNDGNSYIEIINGAVAVVVTIVTPKLVDGLAVADQVVTVPATETRKIGPFPPGTYNQTSTDAGSIHVDFDDISNVTIGAFSVN